MPRPYHTLLSSGVLKTWKKITAFRNRVFNLFPKLLLLRFFFCFYEMVTATAKSPQSCPTLCNPIDGNPPGSSVHGIFQARVLEWGATILQRIFPTQGLNLGLLHCRQTLYSLSHQGSSNLMPNLINCMQFWFLTGM